MPEQAVLSSIWDTKRLFAYANELLREKSKEDFFEVKLIGLSEQLVFDGGSCVIKVDSELADVRDTDLIIVPAIWGDVLRATQLNKNYFPWLVRQYEKGTEIATYCVGAFLVAATGLLNGKQCATHWAYANEILTYYPEVKLMPDKMVIEQNGIYSCGGGTAFWNLLLYLLDKFTNRQVVIAATKYFLLDLSRDSQSEFLVFKGQREHGDLLVERVQLYLEANYREKININRLAEEFSIVRRTLERRFRKATRNTIAEYIQRTKIEVAKKEIEMNRKTINEIMYGLGYADKRAFKELFLRITGLTPMEYKRKYADG